MQQPTKVDLRLFVRKKDTTPTTKDGAFYVSDDQITKSVTQLNDATLPDNSCVKYINLHMDARIVKEWTIRSHRNNSVKTEIVNPTMTISVETDNLQYGCKQRGSCRGNLASGKCCDAFAIEHIGRLFWPNKYPQKVK